MLDITMCSNYHCPSAMACYRFTALPKEECQSYAGFSPMPGEDKCKDYLPAQDQSAGAKP